MAAEKDIPTTDLKELIALFKKEPGKWTYASAGIGTTLHHSKRFLNIEAPQ